MKIGLLKFESMTSLYGSRYDENFFNDLWKRYLLNKVEIDEVVYFNYEAIRKADYFFGDVDAIIGAWITDDMLSEEFLSKHSRLRYISTLAHGFGRVDQELCKRHHLTVTNTIYGDVTIAQYAMALLLDICHNVSLHDNYYKNNKWKDTEPVKMILTPQIELYGKTIGIIGLGNIGLWTARMAAGFGMNVIAYSRNKKEGNVYEFIKQVSYDKLLQQSDVISIHCPLTEDTRNMIDSQSFSKMKNGVILINTARGAIIDENSLIDALNSGKVYAAGLDVVAGEPLSEPNELMKCKNTKITEHIAWTPVESRIRSVEIASQNFINWMEGNPTSVIC